MKLHYSPLDIIHIYHHLYTSTKREIHHYHIASKNNCRRFNEIPEAKTVGLSKFTYYIQRDIFANSARKKQVYLGSNIRINEENSTCETLHTERLTVISEKEWRFYSKIGMCNVYI